MDYADRVIFKTWYEGECYAKLTTFEYVVQFLDMMDCDPDIEDYEIWYIPNEKNAVPTQLWYAGWQPGCIIDIIDKDGEIVYRGIGTDH